MLDQIVLNFGASSSSQKLKLQVQTVNIVVGPNNSGKSTFLREIEQLLQPSTFSNQKPSIVNSIDVNLPNKPGELWSLVEPYIESESEYSSGQDSALSIRKFDLLDERMSISNINLPKSLLVNPLQYDSYGFDEHRKKSDLRQIVHLFTTRLDGATRLSLIKNRETGRHGDIPKNVLMTLLQDRRLRREVRRAIFDAIELYISLDVTDPRTIIIKLSKQEPKDVHEIQWGEEANAYHRDTEPATAYGDGTKAFIGLTIATALPNTKVFLVDEPEAFLHPPLAKKLGTHLSKLAERQKIQMLFATHSADFLMGCVGASKNVNIIRLTYKSKVPTARLLDSSALSLLLDDPIMRQSNVLSSLFHEGVLLTEDDMDRVFYQEINLRLENDNRVYAKDCLFLNFNGKDAMYKVVKPLRAMGIPTTCLLDFDFISGSSKTNTFSTLISVINMPVPTALSIKQARQAILDNLAESERSDAKKSGIKSFKEEQRAAVRDLLDNLAQYGIFVVPNGEIESFLPQLAVGKRKRAWFYSVMDSLGHNPDNDGYVETGTGDVWEFMERVGKWIADPERKGMPIE